MTIAKDTPKWCVRHSSTAVLLTKSNNERMRDANKQIIKFDSTRSQHNVNTVYSLRSLRVTTSSDERKRCQWQWPQYAKHTTYTCVHWRSGGRSCLLIYCWPLLLNLSVSASICRLSVCLYVVVECTGDMFAQHAAELKQYRISYVHLLLQFAVSLVIVACVLRCGRDVSLSCPLSILVVSFFAVSRFNSLHFDFK